MVVSSFTMLCHLVTLLAGTQITLACVDLLFALDPLSANSYSQALHVARDLSLRPELRVTVVNDENLKNVKLGGELFQAIGDVKGSYDRMLAVVSKEVIKRRGNWPLVVLLFSDMEVDEALMKTWKSSNTSDLHIFRVGKQFGNLMTEQGKQFQELISCSSRKDMEIRRLPQTNIIMGVLKQEATPTPTTFKPFSRTTRPPVTARNRTTGPKLRAVFRGGTTAFILDEEFQALATTTNVPKTTARSTTSSTPRTTTSHQIVNDREIRKIEFNFLRSDTKKLFIPAIKTTSIPTSTTTLFRLPQSTTAPTTTTTLKPVPRGCVADIIFLVDLSQGTGDRTKHYFDVGASAVGALPIGANAVKVGMIGYSGPGRTRVIFDLDKHSNKDDLIEEMFKMVATGGTTRTGEAISFATKELLKNKANGTRSNAKKVLVVFTDGYSQDDPMSAASNARHQGIRTIVVAMQDLIPPNHAELLHIAGQKEYILLSPKGSQLRGSILGNSCTLTAI